MIKKIPYFLGGLLILVLVLSPLLIKVSVICRSQFGSCPKEIEEQLTQLNNNNLFQARIKSSRLLKKNLLVNDFTMQYKIPNILEVNLLIKKPEFAVLDKTTGKYGLVDKDGAILVVQSSSTLPTVVVGSKNLKVGDNVSATEFFDLELMRGIWAMYQVSSGEVLDESLVVELPGSIRVILPQEGDLNVLLGEIRLVYGKVESPDTAGKYSEIDLRFKNPVLR